MGTKITYLYKAEMKSGGETVKTAYFYSRNAELVKKFCRDNYKPLTGYNHIDVSRVGECKYLVNEPVVEFNEEETAQIERYFMKEMVKYAYFQQQYGLSETV